MHTQLHALADQTGQFIVMPLKELQKQGFDVEWHIDTWMRYVILAGFSRLLAEAVLRGYMGTSRKMLYLPHLRHFKHESYSLLHSIQPF